ncbi:MAG: TlpA family protein disulfide reductase [Myxococcota bacterium]
MRAGCMVLALTMGCAAKTGGDVQSMAKQVTELQARVAELESFQAKVEMVLDLPADPAREMAALELAYAARDALGAGETDKAKTLLKQILDDYSDTQVAAPAMDMMKELAVVGSDAGALDVTAWVQGEHALNPEKLTVLVFFEQWCPHCQRELPELQKTYSELKTDGLDMVGLTGFSRGTTSEQMTQFLADAKVTFPVGRDDGALSKRYAANGVPHAAVVRGGKVLWIGHPGELGDETLRKWLDEAP